MPVEGKRNSPVSMASEMRNFNIKICNNTDMKKCQTLAVTCMVPSRPSVVFASAILSSRLAANKSRMRGVKCKFDTRRPGPDAGRRGHVVGNDKNDWIVEGRSHRKREYENKVVCYRCKRFRTKHFSWSILNNKALVCFSWMRKYSLEYFSKIGTRKDCQNVFWW